MSLCPIERQRVFAHKIYLFYAYCRHEEFLPVSMVLVICNMQG